MWKWKKKSKLGKKDIRLRIIPRFSFPVRQVCRRERKKNPRLCTLRNRQKVKANKHNICSLIMKTILKVKSGVMKQAVQYSSELALVWTYLLKAQWIKRKKINCLSSFSTLNSPLKFFLYIFPTIKQTTRSLTQTMVPIVGVENWGVLTFRAFPESHTHSL